MPNCIELGNCVFPTPMDMVNYPYLVFFGDWFYIIFYTMIIGIVYLINKDMMLTGIVGIVVAGFFTGTSIYTNSSTGQAFHIGYILLALSIGIVLFQLIRTKVNNP